MVLKVGLINFMYIFLLMLEVLVLKYYQENLDLENKLFIYLLVDSYYLKFILRCVCFCVMCNGCNCFSFNFQIEMCWFYFLCDLFDGIVVEEGWILYSNLLL